MGSQKDYNEICHIKTRLSLLFFGEICRERSCLLAVEFAKIPSFGMVLSASRQSAPGEMVVKNPDKQHPSIHHSLISRSPRHKYSVRVQRVGAGGWNPLRKEEETMPYVNSWIL